MLATIEVQVLLAGQLVHGIGCKRRLGRVFFDSQTFAVVAIDCRAGGKQHTLDAIDAHGLANIQSADEVALVGFHRVVHRGLHRRNGGQVNNGLAACGRALDQLAVSDIAFDQLKPGVVHLQVGGLAGGQIIKDPYRVTLCQ